MAHKFFSYIFRHQLLLVFFLVITGWFVYQIRGILTSVFISYIIMAALLPYVQYFQQKKFPRAIAVLIPYLTTLIVLFMLIFPLIPFMLSQVQLLLNNLPDYVDQAARILGFAIDANQIQNVVTSELSNVGRNAFAVTSAVFGGVFSLLTILIVGFYLLFYNDHFKRNIAELFHRKDRDAVLKTLEQIDDKLGSWLRGQLVLCLSIGILTFITLSILQLPFALPLAVLAGILEVIPTLGPTLSAIPAVIVALTVSPQLALIVVGAYIIIQTLENNILVPKIMQKAVGLNPVIVILGVMIGANLMGVVGALLSIPFISFVIVLSSSLQKNFSEK